MASDSKHRPSFNAILATVTVFGLSIAPVAPAYAYIDPGTGSMIVQILVGGIVGGLVAIKLYWRKFKTYIAEMSGKKTDRSPK